MIDLDNITLFDKLKSLISNKSFICLTLSLSVLYFVITGIQFWISDYFIVVLGVAQEKVFVYFSVSCITGPTMGVMVGGFIV